MHIRDIPFRPMGDQSGFEPRALERFVAEPRIAILAYARRDGTPNQLPIWYAYEDGRFLMLTSSTSPKAKAIARNSRVCLTIQDDTPPYRVVIMDGEVTMTKAEVKSEFHTALARRYFGRLGGAEYEKQTLEESTKSGVTLMTFEADRIRGFDGERTLSSPVLAFMKARNLLPIPNDWL